MNFLYYAVIATGLAGAASGASPGAVSADDYFRAIRAGDLKTLQTLSRSGVAGVKDGLNWTPLHFAALYGSTEAIRILLEAGGDPNARNLYQSTPLMFGAYSFEKTRLMLEKGGDVNARASNGSTPLWVAEGAPGNDRTVRLLLEKGANAKEMLNSGVDHLMRAAAHQSPEVLGWLLEKGADPHRADASGDTALMDSVGLINHENARILIDAGADVNAANTDGGRVKNGRIDLFGLTPLMLEAAVDDAAGISALLKAGAKPDATDHRHMTALMMAIATDRAKAENVRRLIEAGADVNIPDRNGETALDWAQKFRNPEILALLKEARAKGKGLPPAPSRPADYKPDAREAIARASGLIAKSSEVFYPAGGACIGCHHQPFAARAFGALKAAGLPADARLRQPLLTGEAPERIRKMNAVTLLIASGGLIDQFLYPLTGMAEAGEPSNAFTDAMVHYVAETQEVSGEWSGSSSRPPLQESEITRTRMAIQALKTYGWPAQRAEFDERIARARTWLLTAQAWTTVDEADRIAGLWMAGADPTGLRKLGAKLLSMQRADGGWAQTQYLDSDAFGTAAVLDSLRRAGLLETSDPAYKRGARFLLETQYPDGSWYVRSRAVKLQPYFQSAFPYDHDQWISNSATAYAVIALAPVAGGKTVAAR